MSNEASSFNEQLPRPPDGDRYAIDLDRYLRNLVAAVNLQLEPFQRYKTNGQLLTASSDDLSGVKWAAAAGGNYTTPQFTGSAIVSIANSIVETTMFGAGSGTLTIAANALSAGSVIRAAIRGTTLRTGTPTLRMRAKLGGTTVADTGVTISSIENGAGMSIDAMLTCITAGAGGTVIGQISALYRGVTTTMYAMSVTTAAVALNTTIANVLDLTALWSVASASNVLALTNSSVEVFHP